jgi:hypothetical protein
MRTIILLLFIGFHITVKAQNTRIIDFNSIGWYNAFITKKITKKWSAHLEYQWRRTNVVTDWQQSLLRAGLNYRVNKKLMFRAGYGWIETFPYGNIPLQAAGKTFTEHRSFQAIFLDDTLGSLDIQHRFMLEQRWVGRYLNPVISIEDDYVFTNRLRYMLRLQIPLGKKRMEDRTFYAAFYDEIFIQFGNNVQENIFDQNRICGLLGYRVNKNFRLEAGYLSQFVMFGREIKGNNVLQKNNGLIVNTYFNF